MTAKILSFVTDLEVGPARQVGRVHTDGSVSFRGRRYRTLREVPPECQGLRPDLETHRQWRALYRPIDPRSRSRRRLPFGGGDGFPLRESEEA